MYKRQQCDLRGIAPRERTVVDNITAVINAVGNVCLAYGVERVDVYKRQMLSGCASENDIPVSSISYKLPEKLAAGKFDGDYAEKMDKTTYSYSDRNIYRCV